jgi:hypothetical protein
VWLSPKFLEWQISIGGHEEQNRNFGAHSYEIWTHGEQLLRQSSEQARISGLTSLWRAIDHRMRLLERINSLKSIPIKDKPSDLLNLLEFLGIVRPLMLQKLKEIRNAVEHQDAIPPDTESCRVFLEFTWYFLRSTDGMTQRVPTHLLLESGNTPNEEADYWVEVDNGPRRRWVPKIAAWLTPDLVSAHPEDHWFRVNEEHTETRADLIRREKDLINDFGRGRDPEDIFITGEIRGPSEPLKNLTKLFLGI